MNVQEIVVFAQTRGLDIGLRLIAALVIWFVGRFLIKLAIDMTGRAATKRGVDPTLIKYATSAINVVLTVILVVALLGYFGVETASFAALLAGVGLAIGTAWGGLLQNFAAGVFMVALRPFRVGDTVTIAGITGVVEEIGLITTTVNTFDNVKTIIGNNKVFGDTIQNYDANPYRRVDTQAQLATGTDFREAANLFKEKLRAMPHVLEDPAPVVEILSFNLAGPVLGVRPYTTPEHYWDVFFATHAMIRETCGEAGFATPGQHINVSDSAAAVAAANTMLQRP